MASAYDLSCVLKFVLKFLSWNFFFGCAQACITRRRTYIMAANTAADLLVSSSSSWWACRANLLQQTTSSYIFTRWRCCCSVTTASDLSPITWRRGVDSKFQPSSHVTFDLSAPQRRVSYTRDGEYFHQNNVKFLQSSVMELWAEMWQTGRTDEQQHSLMRWCR